MVITAKDVMNLRKRTSLGMMECKKALTQTQGDVEKAIELLRETVGAKMAERSDREAAEGAIAVASTDNAIALVFLKSETDFTAKNDEFLAGARKIAELALVCEDGDVANTPEMEAICENLRITIKENISVAQLTKMSGSKVGSYVHHTNKLGVILTGEGDLSDDLLRGLCQHLMVSDDKMFPRPIAISEDQLPQDEVENKKQAFIAEATATGKPAEIAEKMSAGKLRKWVEDRTLLSQIYVPEQDAKKPVSHYLPQGAKLVAFTRMEVGG